MNFFPKVVCIFFLDSIITTINIFESNHLLSNFMTLVIPSDRFEYLKNDNNA